MQVRDHCGNLISRVERILARAQVDRRHCDKWLTGQFRLGVQVSPEGTAAYGQNGVIDGRFIYLVFDRTKIIERKLPAFEYAVRRDLAIEAGPGRF